MSLSQALKLARNELAGLSGTAKLQRFGQIVRLFASEVTGTVQLAPFGLKASQLYSRLGPPPASNANSSSSEEDVYVVKSIYYGTKRRNTVDLYLPGQAAQQQRQQGLPVVLFVHGGVWAAGESWHYAPLATSLARLGVITCVMQYTLYPDALVPQLVQEVSAAFDWALENVGSYGGDPKKVSLVGHSAGAQLCMMALLQRAQAAHVAATAAVTRNANGDGTGQQRPQPQQRQQQLQNVLSQMPQQFVGVTGVYDIAKHYAYEKDRGVHSLSTMLPAMGGFQHFAANSPSVILGAALQQQLAGADLLAGQQQQQGGNGHGAPQQQQQQQQQQLEQQELPACDFYNSFSLIGESIAHRIGFDRGSDHYASSEAGLMLQSLEGMAAVPQFDAEAAAYLPPTVLMSSCTDLTVPWFESAELYWRLFDCGVPVKHLVYNKVGHGEFVTNWPGSFARSEAQDSGSSSSSSNSSSSSQHRAALLQQLPPYCRDLAVVVGGQPPVNFVHKSKVSPPNSSSSSSGGNGESASQKGSSVQQGSRRLDAIVAAAGLRPEGGVPSEWN